MDAEADEGEETLGQDDDRDVQRGENHDRAQHVRHDVTEDDLERLGAGGAGGLDEFLLAQRDGLAAHDARHGQPFDRADRHEDEHQVGDGTIGLHHRHQHDDEEHERDRIEHVDEAHHAFVEPAANETGDGAISDANTKRDKRCGEANEQGNAQSEDETRDHVAAFGIGAEQVHVLERRRDGDAVTEDGVVLVDPQERAKQRNENQDGDDVEARHRRRIAHQAPARVFPERAAFDCLRLWRVVDQDVAHAVRLRGSRTRYMRSAARFRTIMRNE